MIREMERNAVISADQKHRYLLTRLWDGGLAGVTFVMLNPSTADATHDDATVRKCVGFAQRYGFGQIAIVNLFSLRARDPVDLIAAQERNGPDADFWIGRATSVLDRPVLVAWGSVGARFPDRTRAVLKLIGRAVRCLSLTKDSHPSHPLMLPYSCVPQPFEIGGGGA
jgi:hypothetical protein